MDTSEAVRRRILELCRERHLTPHGLSICAAVPCTTLQGILKRKNSSAKIVTIKKLCDGLDITLGQFFRTPEFEQLEQEIK